MRRCVVALVFALGCTEPVAPEPDGPPVAVGLPSLSQPSSDAPLARLLSVTLARPAALVGTATDGDIELSFSTELALSHEIALVGLSAGAVWTVELVARDDDGDRATFEPLTFETAPLPPNFPHVGLRVASDTPSFTLLPLYCSELALSWLVVVDERGRVRWWLDGAGEKFAEAVPVSGGLTFLHAAGLEERDWLGRVRVRLEPTYGTGGGTSVPVTTFHHDVSITAQGSWLALSKEVRTLPDLPLSYVDPSDRGPTLVMGDVLVELDPRTATVVGEWPITDVIDASRIGFGSLNAAAVGVDWAHANAAHRDEDGGSIVSLRHQDAVIRLEPDGSLDWILANPDNWSEPYAAHRLEGLPGIEWPYHQHAPRKKGDRLILFDNGNERSSPFTGVPSAVGSELYSRVVEFRIDAAARTVEQVWQWEPPLPLYASAMGDADWLDSGDVLATFALVQWEGGVANAALGRGASVRVIEIERPSDTILWDLELQDPVFGWHSFRAERLDSFGPTAL